MKLTKAQKNAIDGLQRNEPVSAFPCDGTAPTLKFVKRLCDLGLVEIVGKDTGRLAFAKFAMTEASSAAFKEADIAGYETPNADRCKK